MKTRSLSLALALAAGCAGLAAAEAPLVPPGAPPGAPPSPLVMQRDRNVGALLPGAPDDRAAFQAAIDAVPPGGEAVIAVPDIGRPWRLPGGYLDPGDRSITWAVDPGVTINDGKPVEWMRLNGPVTTGRGVLAYGFGNKDDNTGFRIRIGGGGVFANPDAGISGFDGRRGAGVPARARACRALHVGVGRGPDRHRRRRHRLARGDHPAEGGGPDEPAPRRHVRRRAGDDFPEGGGQPWRYTTRITGWKADGDHATALEIEGWYRSNPKGKEAIRETPSVNRETRTGRILVNPLNKVWGSNLNVYLSKADAPPLRADLGQPSPNGRSSTTPAPTSPPTSSRTPTRCTSTGSTSPTSAETAAGRRSRRAAGRRGSTASG